jgi:hypothetical protein
MNIKVNFKENRAKRHACASSNICRMAYAITEWSLEATTKSSQVAQNKQTNKQTNKQSTNKTHHYNII